MKSKDPHFLRESQRYQNPIASRELILATIEDKGRPLSEESLATILEIDDAQREALSKRLRAMEQQGQLVCNRRRQYGLISRMDLRVGFVRGNKDGSGMLIPDDGTEAMHLSHLQMHRVFDGDKVIVSPRNHLPTGERECVITEVLQRNTRSLTGFYNHGREVGYVAPRNKRIRSRIIVKGSTHNLEGGELVEVEIVQQPGRYQQPEGRISQVLSPQGNELNEIQIAQLTHNLPKDWSPEVEEEVSQLQSLKQGASYDDRVDLRDVPLVTIDGADSRDFDDAVFCDKLPRGAGWKLLVAIADVGHYVAIGSALDSAARLRGNSVYFPRDVIPMLPERLSNDLCSLNPGVDRLVMVCEMHISRAGICKNYQVYQGVIKSHARLTYDQVNEYIDGKGKLDATSKVKANIDNLTACYQQLLRQRDKRGALQLEVPEHRIIFNDDRTIRKIVATHRGTSNKIIEEVMVLANCCLARLFSDLDVPTLYRVHKQPDPLKVEKTRSLMHAISGFTLGGKKKPKPADFARLVGNLEGHPLHDHCAPIILRTMQQAVYTPENLGHYGLALEYYCHFTSPIRRYPDLIVHRGIKALLRTTESPHLRSAGKVKQEQKLFNRLYPYTRQGLHALGTSCTIRDNQATEASLDVFAYLSCAYLQQFIGQTFDGVIQSVTSFGLFVSIGNTNVEGLLHISNLLSDYYHFDADRMELAGERTGRQYTLGQKVKIILSEVDIVHGRVDLVMANQKTLRDGKNRGKKSLLRRTK